MTNSSKEITHPWEFYWYFNQLPQPTRIKPHHFHAIMKYCNISELYYAIPEDKYENHRFEFPEWIECIDLSYNTLYDFYEGSTIDYPLPPQLELFNVAVNKLSRLPERLPKTLTGLMCRGNQIIKLPRFLPVSLENLNASYNCLGEFNPEYKLENIETLRMNNNRLRFFDWSKLGNKLQILDLSENQLDTTGDIPNTVKEFRMHENLLTEYPDVPDNLQVLDISKNKIREIHNFPHTLEVCLIAHNKLTYINEADLMACNKLRDLDYQGNHELKPSIEFLDFIEERFHDLWVSGARERALEAFQRGDLKSLPPIYDDPQNVHHVDASLITNANVLLGGTPEDHALDPVSCEELLEEADKLKVPKDVLMTIKEEWTMRSNKSAIHVSIGDIWKAFWGRLRAMKRKERESLVVILTNEVRESNNVCFTGRIGRILGILQGFDEGIAINIPLNEQIVARYTACQRRLERKKIPEDSLSYLWQLEYNFTLELLELGVDKEKRDEWLLPIKDDVREAIMKIGKDNWVDFWINWKGEGIDDMKELFLDYYGDELDL